MAAERSGCLRLHRADRRRHVPHLRRRESSCRLPAVAAAGCVFCDRRAGPVSDTVRAGEDDGTDLSSIRGMKKPGG